MAASAHRVFSLRGFMTETIQATDIKSRADARKKGPFTDEEGNLMLWAKSTWRDRRQIRRACFRHYPTNEGGQRELRRMLQDEYEQREAKCNESALHKTAKAKLAEHLRQLVAAKRPIFWHFNDPEASDFSFSGNLLADVVDVIEEKYSIELPFGIEYRPDIALLGPKIRNKRILLGIIELELSNEAELVKCLFCKTTGAPIMLINLRDTSLTSLTDNWCRECIAQTTQTTPDGRRDRNYVLLHTMLYPVFTDAPTEMFPSEHHQFLVFLRKPDIVRFRHLVEVLMTNLHLSDSDVTVSPVRLNAKDRGSVTLFENEGRIAGNLWREYNESEFIRLAVRRPVTKSGPLYQFHLLLTTLLNAHFDALVGYKYGKGADDLRPDDPLWIWQRWNIKEGRPITHRLLPKHVSEPVRKIASLLGKPLGK